MSRARPLDPDAPGWRGLAINAVVCTTIALIIQVLVDDTDFLSNLFVSFTIGYCIYGTVGGAFRLLSPRVPAPLIVVLGLATGLVVALVIIGVIAEGDPLYLLRDRFDVLLLGIIFGTVATGGFMLLGDLWDVRARLERAEREALRRDKALAEAELRVLQARIEPHFLFNTLANVSSLIDVDPTRARTIVERLTTLLRGALARSRAGRVSVGEECALLRDYLEIQSLRTDGRIDHRIDVDPAAAAIELPALLIQPLVENAVLHGLEPSAAAGTVSLSARRIDERLEIVVEDDGVGMGTTSRGTGTGLANVRERLRAQYGDAARLELLEGASGGVLARLTLPVDAADPTP